MYIISKKLYFSEYGQFIYIENSKNISIKGWDNNGKNIKAIIIPDKINGKPIVSVGKQVFKNSNLTEIEIPDNVIKIGDKAFYGSELLEKVKLSSNLTKINTALFWFCNIRTIIIPNTIKEIKSGAFFSNPLIEIFIGNNVKLDKDSFDPCQNNKNNETDFYSIYNKNNRKEGRYIKTETVIKDEFDEKVGHIHYIWKYQN
jgi:hypothetical protein